MSSPKFGGLFLCAYMLSFWRESDACTFESKALAIDFYFYFIFYILLLVKHRTHNSTVEVSVLQS